MKPAERRHLRTHQVQHSGIRRVRCNTQDGFCKVAAACINQARRIIFGEISVYSKVADRPRHCYTCGVIQQLLTTYIEERLHQHIRHNVATLAKALPWFNKMTIKSIAAGRNGRRSTSTYPSLPPTTYSRGRRSTTQKSASNWTSLSRGRNSTSRQLVTTWFKWQRSSTYFYSAPSYLRTGESLLVQQQWYNVTRARNQTTRGLQWIEETYGAIRWGRFCIITRQELLYKELALTDDFVHHGDSKRPSSRYGGENFPAGSFTTLACTVWTDRRRLKSRPEREKTESSPNTFSVKYNSYQ